MAWLSSSPREFRALHRPSHYDRADAIDFYARGNLPRESLVAQWHRFDRNRDQSFSTTSHCIYLSLAFSCGPRDSKYRMETRTQRTRVRVCLHLPAVVVAGIFLCDIRRPYYSQTWSNGSNWFTNNSAANSRLSCALVSARQSSTAMCALCAINERE